MVPPIIIIPPSIAPQVQPIPLPQVQASIDILGIIECIEQAQVILLSTEVGLSEE